MKDETELLGIYGYRWLDNVTDFYCTKPFKKKPPPTYFDGEKRRFFHKYAATIIGGK
jgi:hypothetical protein